jgi:hypothetical protein
VNRDPIGELGGVNLFAMVNNHLTGSIDFLGLLTRATADRIVNSVLGTMRAQPRGHIYESGSDECMERDLMILESGVMVDGLRDSMVSLMFASLGGIDAGLLARLGLSGLEALIKELTTGDRSLDEEEIIGHITTVFASISPTEVRMLLPLAREIIAKDIGDTIGDIRIVQKKRSRLTPEVGTEVSCQFMVSALTSSRWGRETYSDFTVFGTCESNCKSVGAVRCPCGCSSKFEIIVKGTKSSRPARPPTITKKEFRFISD